MLFTSQSTPLPLLCRKLLPLSQQLRQESGKFLGIRLKNLVSLHQLFEYCFCSFLHKSIFGYWYFGLETKKARSGEPLFMLFPPLFIIVFHITTHAVIIHIILRGRIKAAHIIRLMGRSTLLFHQIYLMDRSRVDANPMTSIIRLVILSPFTITTNKEST